MYLLLLMLTGGDLRVAGELGRLYGSRPNPMMELSLLSVRCTLISVSLPCSFHLSKCRCGKGNAIEKCYLYFCKPS